MSKQNQSSTATGPGLQTGAGSASVDVRKAANTGTVQVPPKGVSNGGK